MVTSDTPFGWPQRPVCKHIHRLAKFLHCGSSRLTRNLNQNTVMTNHVTVLRSSVSDGRTAYGSNTALRTCELRVVKSKKAHLVFAM